MLIRSDNSTSPSLWLSVLSLAYRTVHAIMVIGLPILMVIGLFWGMIIFVSYETMVPGPAAIGQDPAGRDSKISNKIEGNNYQGGVIGQEGGARRSPNKDRMQITGQD